MTPLGRRIISAICAVILAVSMVPTTALAAIPSGGGLTEGETTDVPTMQGSDVSERGKIHYEVVDCLDRYDVKDAVLDSVHSLPDGLITPFAFDGDEVPVKVRAAYDLICEGMKKHEEKISVEACSITVAELKDAMDLVFCNPELWWLGTSYRPGYYMTASSIDECQAASVSPGYAYSASEVSALTPEIEETIADALSWLGPNMTEFEKAQVLHDYLVRTCQYSVEVAEGGESKISNHRAVSALSGDKTTVCQGYALAYKWLLRRAGVDAVYVASEEMNHGWNLVNVDGSWHHVDVTWDDPLYENRDTGEVFDGGFDARVSHTYFLKSDSSFQTMEDPHTGWATSLQALNDYPLAEGFIYPEYKTAYQYDCNVDGHKEPVIYRENEKAATCTEKGSYDKVSRCSACKEMIGVKEAIEIPALGHKYGQYIFDNNATCTKNGTETAVCSICGEKDTQEKANTMTNHTRIRFTENKVEATCTKEGSYDEVVRCTSCSKELSRTTQKIEKKAHVVGKTEESIIKDPTCEESGRKAVKSWCSVCNTELAQEEKVVSALGHSYGAWITAKATTCTAAGSERRVCKTCGAATTRVIPAEGHAFGPYRSNGDARVNVDGTETARCSRCSATQTRTAAGSALAPAVGQTVAVAGAAYQTTGAATLAYAGPSNRKAASVTIPATVSISGRTYQITAIAPKAFAGNKALKSVKIGANVQAVPANAFKGCTKLASVSFGNNVISIGKNAFSGCKALKSVTLGTKVTLIGDGAFQNCAKLTKATVKSAKLSKIGKNAFAGCKKLGTITLKTTKLKSVGKNAFKGTKSKMTVKVPKKKLKVYQKLCKNKGSKTIRVKK